MHHPRQLQYGMDAILGSRVKIGVAFFPHVTPPVWYMTSRVTVGVLQAPFLADKCPFTTMDAKRYTYGRKNVVCCNVKKNFKFVQDRERGRSNFYTVNFVDLFEGLDEYKEKDVMLLIQQLVVTVDAVTLLLQTSSRGRGRGRDSDSVIPFVAFTITPLKVMDKDYWHVATDGLRPLAAHGFAGQDCQCPVNLQLDACTTGTTAYKCALSLLDGGVFDTGRGLDEASRRHVGYRDVGGKITFTDKDFAPAVNFWGRDAAGKEHGLEEVEVAARHLDNVRSTYFPYLRDLKLQVFNPSALSISAIQSALKTSGVYLCGTLVWQS